MQTKAQASLEYLMTYGWALILIATVIGVLVFVVMSPSSTVTFTSSDPTKIMLKAGAVSGSTASIVLQNITGGSIEITSAGGCQVNESSPPVNIPAGSIIELVCDAPSGQMPPITVEYTDFAGLQRSVGITASGTAGGTSLPAGLVAWYKLDDNEIPATAEDSSGNGNSGTLSGPIWETTGCVSGECLSFNGTGDYVSIPDSSSLRMQELTLSAWIYSTDIGVADTIIDKRDSSAGCPNCDSYVLKIWNAGQIRFCIEPATEQSCLYTTASAVSAGVWTHVVVTWDGTIIRAYKDGVVDPETEPHTTTITYNPWPVLIGAEDQGGTIQTFFNGKIDEVKIYNRALDAGEICSLCQAHASAGACNNCTT